MMLIVTSALLQAERVNGLWAVFAFLYFPLQDHRLMKSQLLGLDLFMFQTNGSYKNSLWSEISGSDFMGTSLQFT